MDDEKIRTAKLPPQNQLSMRPVSSKIHWTKIESTARSENSPWVQDSLSFFETPSIDRRVLDRIRIIQSRGNPGLLKNVLGLYFQEAPKLLNLLREATDISDAEGMYQAAHTLKSSSANLGAIRLARLCCVVEALARSEEPLKARLLVTFIETEYSMVRSALGVEQ